MGRSRTARRRRVRPMAAVGGESPPRSPKPAHHSREVRWVGGPSERRYGQRQRAGHHRRRCWRGDTSPARTQGHYQRIAKRNDQDAKTTGNATPADQDKGLTARITIGIQGEGKQDDNKPRGNHEGTTREGDGTTAETSKTCVTRGEATSRRPPTVPVA